MPRQLLRTYQIKKKYILPVAYFIFGLIILGVGVSLGWYWKAKNTNTAQADFLHALRIGGYKYISPLLACDKSQESDSVILGSLKNDLQNKIIKDTSAGKVTNVSVYFREFNSGVSLDINPELQYYPASLNKIPIMISLYKSAESNPMLLQQKIQIPDGDQNASQEIMPQEYLTPGDSYTIEDAVNKMIKFSDNNAFYGLIKYTDVNLYKQVNDDLKIPLQDAGNTNDYRTARDFSYFLRVLYNATYINKDLSEKALELLAQVSYANGIRKGVPADVEVAHKFGDATNGPQTSNKFFRELHDCGIIYHTERPYLLCVMTKSEGSLADAESSIQNISKTVYTAVDRDYK